MARWKLTLEYDGSAFRGWQRLAEGASVQAALEAAVFALSGERVECVGAGRTDSGVHALGQVAHVDLVKDWTRDRLRDGLNAHLRPASVAVLSAQPAAPDFHARFSATRRVYLYRIVNRRADLTLDRGRAWRVAARLDHGAMQEAGRLLIGMHDFTTFRDSQCQAKSPIKTLDRCEVRRLGDEIEAWFEARSFLHRQVRSMVGSLVEVGLGKWTPRDLAEALEAADRSRCGPVAPADGLYLVRVDYPASAGDQA
jgi:tRNA pseudouridine38-40 synthase